MLSGTVLWLMGEGLQFASVVALTVSFGLGLSATIHFLNRLRLEDRPDEDPAVGVERATVLVGPALDPDLGGARLRAGRDGVLRPAVAAAVRLAERLRDARGADRRPADPAADGDVPAQAHALGQRQAHDTQNLLNNKPAE